ncbi:MAG: response regulator [Aestuariivirga sp.]
MVSCLLIDGNETERGCLAGMLGSLGFVCAEKSQLPEAVDYARDSKPDLILIEASQQNPAQEFLRLVSIAAPKQPKPVVIFYSDAPNMEDIGASILAGASDFLVHPFDRKLLVFKLQQAGFKLAA